jgi:hypothetical protein
MLSILLLVSEPWRTKDMENYVDLGTGRIAEIITGLKMYYGVESMSELSAEKKLKGICLALQLKPETIDSMILNNSPVFRTVKGHVFEIVFDYIMRDNGIDIEEVGGDKEVDRIVNNHTLQLKTPTLSGTRGNIVQYKTHKTHGAKSEQESMDYYHGISHFSEFLVGLISYDPFKIIFINHDEIPRHTLDRSKILSPFSIVWDGHPGLNNFKRIGIDEIRINPEVFSDKPGQELLPRTAEFIGVNSNIILDTILNEANFRIWDMSIRGFAREIAMQLFLNETKVRTFLPTRCKVERGDKADLALLCKVTSAYRFLQMKGISTNNCSFNGEESIVAIETQLTRGRVNDHPTQSRLYLRTDFDYLIVGLDPIQVRKYGREISSENGLHWQFFAVPTEELISHKTMPHRLNSLQRLNYKHILNQ